MTKQRLRKSLGIAVWTIITVGFSLLPIVPDSLVSPDHAGTLLGAVGPQPATASAPNEVEFLRAHEVVSGVELMWMVVSEKDVDGFKIYRRERGRPIFVMVNNDGMIRAWRYRYVDGSPERETTYEYVLGVVHEDGSEQISLPVEITTSGKASYPGR